MGLLFWKKEDGGLPASVKYIGIPCMTAAFAILGVPGFGAGFLHFLNFKFGLQLDFNQSHTAGWAFLGLGVSDFVIEGVLAICRSHPFIALKEVSFAPIGRALERQDLPVRPKAHKIEPLDCNLHIFMLPSAPDLEVAIRVHSDWARKALALQTVLHSAPVGYYGIVHVPFQFLAGHMVSTFREVYLFELNRQSGRWMPLSDQPGPRLDVTATVGGDLNASDAAIRISISYRVEPHQLDAVLPKSRTDVSLSIAQPRPDAITSYNQVHDLSSRFRTLLDDTRVRGKTIHIFYAGPVSLGFSLGQRISSTIHGMVIVYNFDQNSSVRYPWGLNMALREEDIHVRRF